MSIAFLQKIYPNSGYQVEVGGYLQNLRNSTTIAKIREYHRKFYRPENLVLSITGNIEEEELFEALMGTEEKVNNRRDVEIREPFQRPWQRPLEIINLDKDLISEVEYPSDDESTGHVMVGWRLTQKISEQTEKLGLYKVIMTYLTRKQVSPLELAFVDNADPLATGVSFEISRFKEPLLLIEFENVPIERIYDVVPRLDEVLLKIVSEGPDHFDSEIIKDFVDSETINNMKKLEQSPHKFQKDAVVLDMMYGEKHEDLETFLKFIIGTKEYSAKNNAFWIDLIEDTFINNFKVALIGKPSASKLNELSYTEEERIRKQKVSLGPNGLAQKGKLVQAAIRSQKLAEVNVLKKIPFGKVDDIQFRSIRTNNQNELFDLEDTLFKIQIDDVNTNFVKFHLLFQTESLTIKQKRLLPLLVDLSKKMGIKKDEAITSIEELVKRRTQSLLDISIYLGLDGSRFKPGAYGDIFVIGIQSESKKFAQAINILSDMINFPHITTVNVNATARNMLNNIPELKQKDTYVLNALDQGLYFNNESMIHHTSFLRQKKILEGVLETIKTDPGSVTEELYTMIRTLTRPENTLMLLATDTKQFIRQYGSDLSVIDSLFNMTKQLDKSSLSEGFEVKSDYEYCKVDMDDGVLRHVAYGMGETESSYLLQSYWFNITDWNNSEVYKLFLYSFLLNIFVI